MPQFRKSIVSAGKYLVSKLGGKRAEEQLSESRLRKWAETANKMIQSGISIPAPWSHVSEDGNIPFPVVMGSDGTLPRSDLNAGWWKKFDVENGVLFGILDVPDENSSKIGTTVKDTSVFVRPNYVDGRGNSWEEALMHVALVTHPIEPGQMNFEPIAASLLPNEEPLIIAMSDLIMTDKQDPVAQPKTFTIKDVIDHLEQVGIVLLEDTTPANLAERLVAAIRQKLATEKDSEDDDGTENVTSAPTNSKTQPAPVAMSQEQEKKPDQTSVLTEEQSDLLKDLKKHNAFLMSTITDQKKKELLDRIAELVKTGRVGKDYAEKNLIPEVDGIQMSLTSDGKIAKLGIENILEALESAKPLTKNLVDGKETLMSDLPEDSTLEEMELSFGEEPDLTDAQIDEILVIQ